MAPYKADSFEEDESGSESDSASSKGSSSRSPSPAVSGSGKSRSPSHSREASPAESQHSVQSAHSSANNSPNHSRSNSPQSRHSRSPSHGSERSGSVASHKSASQSSRSHKSISKSPASHKSASRSPASHKSTSRSPVSHKSASKSPASHRSQSRSPASHKSGSRSPEMRKSVSASPDHSPKSRSQSPADRTSKSRSGSPSEKHSSRHSTPKSHIGSVKSRSRTPKSRSRSPVQSKSVSRSPKSRSQTPHSPKVGVGGSSHRSDKSSSPVSQKSKSKSPPPKVVDHDSRSNTPDLQIDDGHRSGSGSPASKHSDENKTPKKKKMAVLSDSDDSDVGTKKIEKKRKRITLSGGESGSDAGSTGAKKKQKNLIDSDSEDEPVVEKPDTMTADALFGDASDISSEDEGKKDKESEREERDGSVSPRRERDGDSGSEKLSDREDARRSDSEERRGRSGDEDEAAKEPEPEVEPIPETRIDADIPKITTDLGKELHFVKLPNFLSVETRPFDKETYEDEIDEEETLDEEGRARLKLKVENTIRWRTEFDKNGDAIKESNARIIKWSDGSMSLHLGSEIFDVYRQPLHGDFNHLFVRQGTGLLGQAVFRTKLTFRPHSTESFTHRKMTLSLADRSTKTSGIKILSQVGIDPDQDRQYQLKKEEQELRASMRMKGSTGRAPGRRVRGGTGGEGGGTTGRGARGDDGSDDEGAISLQAIKNKYKSGHQQHKPAGGQIYSSDEDASDVETHRARRLDRAKALDDSEDERGSGSGGDEDDRRGKKNSATPSPAGSRHSGSDSD